MKTIWQNPNGTWSHHMNAKCEWAAYDDCATDLALSQEWAR